MEFDFSILDEDEKYEFFALAFESINLSYEEGLTEALICEFNEISDEADEVDDNYYVFLPINEWYSFLESTKSFFIDLQEYELCNEIVNLQKKILSSDLIKKISN